MSQDMEPIAGLEESDTGNLQQIQECFQNANRILHELEDVEGAMFGALDDLLEQIGGREEFNYLYTEWGTWHLACRLLDEINERYGFDRL